MKRPLYLSDEEWEIIEEIHAKMKLIPLNFPVMYEDLEEIWKYP